MTSDGTAAEAGGGHADLVLGIESSCDETAAPLSTARAAWSRRWSARRSACTNFSGVVPRSRGTAASSTCSGDRETFARPPAAGFAAIASPYGQG
jgi:hypothetical protein